MDTYRTISSPAQAKITVKKSSFLAFAHPIDNEQQAQDLIRDYRKRYYDARHVCYAFAVVRYFGGILLGTPGLIAAYREAATAALQAADIVTRTREQQAVIEFDYSAMNNVMKIIKERSIRVVSQQTDMRCTLTISAPVSVMEVALPQLAKFTSSPSS